MRKNMVGLGGMTASRVRKKEKPVIGDDLPASSKSGEKNKKSSFGKKDAQKKGAVVLKAAHMNYRRSVSRPEELSDGRKRGPKGVTGPMKFSALVSGERRGGASTD